MSVSEIEAHGAAPVAAASVVTVPLFADTLDVLRGAVHGVCTDASRPVICGVLVEVGGGKLRATGTDSYKLVHRSCDLPTATGPVVSYIIPGKALGAALKGVPMGVGSLTICWAFEPLTQEYVQVAEVHYRGLYATIPCTEGEFVNWRRLTAPSLVDLAPAVMDMGVNPFLFMDCAKGLGATTSLRGPGWPGSRLPVIVLRTGGTKPYTICLGTKSVDNFAMVMGVHLAG